MHASIAFVGAGPTTIYTLHALIERAEARHAITIFEEQAVAGLGTPYRPGWNDPAMLANIASAEMPPLGETLVAWLRRQPEAWLARHDIVRDAIDDRAFYPRLVLGRYLRERFEALVAAARERAFEVLVRTRCRVTDIAAEPDGLLLTLASAGGAIEQARFDRVVIATGHQWPEHPEVRPGYFLSPWPASALADIAATEIGIRGSSLTAIDAAVTLAVAHGAFEEADGAATLYRPEPGGESLRLTMLSRKGLLPEADFYHPLPYEPLTICTPAAIEAAIAQGGDGLLDRTFELFRRELAAADPVYAAKIGLAEVQLEDFCARYFADRIAADPFDWAKRNLAEAEANFAAKKTVGWRYAILRLHEAVAPIVPHLDETDFERFTRDFKPVFVDDYATVPHRSIRRLLALHRAGALEVCATGDAYRIDSHGVERGAAVTIDGVRHAFPVFIDATGQKPLGARDFPFPSLKRQGIVRDAETDGSGARGIAIDDDFHPVSMAGVAERRLFCLSLPFLLGRHPFVQGITSSHELGEVVAAKLAAIAAPAARGRSRART